MSSTNPFDDDYGTPATRQKAKPSRTVTRSYRSKAPRTSEGTEPAIWAARHVEWPLPNSISLANYRKLLKSEGAPEIEDGLFSGFMRSVLNNNADKDNDSEDRASRPLRAPKCVATANGWIVAALECSGTPLRLISRWNVRRAGNEHVVALPPPARGTSPDMARVVHIFVDPTGCHTILSVKNGEAYYLHSSSRHVRKLHGFGPGTPATTLTGISATTLADIPNSNSSNIQKGLTPGSFVTAVAWDREKGTEGSTKTILLGTNLGELYEYSLVAPTEDAKEKDSSVAPKFPDGPLLLHKLEKSTSMEREVAPATGLYFERMVVPGSQGIVVLASSSGRHRRTRLYSFSSSSSAAFQTVLSDGSFIELPGSIDFADLRLCNDNFALRTATGIYYGTLDRGNAGPIGQSNSVIVDAGMLPYDVNEAGVIDVPVSVALTPHHLIILTEANEVRFINRVAQTVIQKERVDWATSTSTFDGVGELLMDIRRPDQVWLRMGRTLVHISSSCEDRDVWKFTLKKCLEPSAKRGNEERELLFERAKSLCSNTVQKAVVTKIRAEYHLQEGRAELSAKYLAQCPPELTSFSETAVRLALPMLGVDDPASYGDSMKAKEVLSSSNMPLITYLGDKMRAGKLNDDSVLCTMIGAWLTELHLHERELDEKQSLLQPFLSNYVFNMDATTIMRILSSHDVSAAESADYAKASGDIGSAVDAAMCMNDELVSGA